MRRLNLLARLIYILTALTLIIPIAVAQEPGKHDRDTIFSFHFDEGDGNEVSDSSGNENHGIFGGGEMPEWVDGPDDRFGSALEFFDSNYVEIPASPDLDTADEITFETWINLNSLTASWSTVYSKNSQSAASGFHWIYINQDGGIAYQYANGSQYVALTAGVDWEFGKWTHLAITHKIDGNSGGIVKWYMEGEQIHEQEHSDKAAEVIGGNASLGTYQSRIDPGRYALDGMLDEVRLSPRVKTHAEIVESMNPFAVEPDQKLAGTWGRIKIRRLR